MILAKKGFGTLKIIENYFCGKDAKHLQQQKKKMWYGNGKESQKCMLKGWLRNQVKVRNSQNQRKYTDIDILYHFLIIWDFRKYIGQKKALSGWFFFFWQKKINGPIKRIKV